MPELLNHRHCKNCDRAITMDEADGLCSTECREAWGVLQKKRKNTIRMFYVAIAVTVGYLLMQLSGRLP